MSLEPSLEPQCPFAPAMLDRILNQMVSAVQRYLVARNLDMLLPRFSKDIRKWRDR